jgi:hypothetical protein
LHALASLTAPATRVKFRGLIFLYGCANFLAIRSAASSPVRKAPSLESPIEIISAEIES